MVKSHLLSKVINNILFYYIALLPSLIVYTTLSEKTLQNIAIVAIIIFFMLNKKIAWTRQVAILWLLWVAYASWTCLAEWLVSGEIHGISFVKAALMIVFPVFVAWAQTVDFGLWLLRGFKFALLIGLFISVYQVYIDHALRAQGSENSLLFAACISVSGLFVLHQSLLKGCFAGHWFVVTAVVIVLSGCQGVMAAFMLSALVLLFFVPSKVALWSIVSPSIVLIIVGVSAVTLLHKNVYILEKNVKSIDVYLGYFSDFLNKDFATRDTSSLASDKNPESQYHLKNEYKTSIGYRIVYLRGGWEVFKQHPIIGVGREGDTLKVGQALGVGSDLALYSHVHNAFLEDMVSGGFVKLLLLLLILVAPIVTFYIAKSKEKFSLAFVVNADFAILGSTNVLFERLELVIPYVLIFVYLYSDEILHSSDKNCHKLNQ